MHKYTANYGNVTSLWTNQAYENKVQLTVLHISNYKHFFNQASSYLGATSMACLRMQYAMYRTVFHHPTSIEICSKLVMCDLPVDFFSINPKGGVTYKNLFYAMRPPKMYLRKGT